MYDFNLFYLHRKYLPFRDGGKAFKARIKITRDGKYKSIF